MEKLIHFFVIIPFLGFIISLLIDKKKEGLISLLAFTTFGVNLLFSLTFAFTWLWKGMPILNYLDVTLYNADKYSFFIDFYFDKISAVYLLVGSLLSFLIAAYSRIYMHNESGYKRFFNTILFFYVGYNTIVLSGNFETLFIGWELLGVSSFLLIAFYRERYLPVKNALRVFIIYRIGDVGLLLAMWMSHHLWHENVIFLKLNDFSLVQEQLSIHSFIGIFISLCILLAAIAKSAQIPFSAWLPRAMEGPTPSSAIFYGSLSVHIGAFLLLRTFPFWEHQISIRILIFVIGLATAIITTLISKVQPTIKSQIAYSSSAQIGIIFIEISLGLEVLALIHFTGNAFMRTYQLLISPSVVNYLVREQFYNFEERVKIVTRNTFIDRIYNNLYVLSLKEWYLDIVLFKIVFNPLKKIRQFLSFIDFKNIMYFFVPLYLTGFYFAYYYPSIDIQTKNYLAVLFALIAFLMVAKAYNERSSARLTWLLVVLSHFFIDLAVTFNDHFSAKEAFVYLSGVVISGLIGYYCLYKVRAFEKHGIGLNKFHGYATQYEFFALIFLLSCLGLSGFPITLTFFGEDLILTHVKENQYVLATLISFTFIINGISVIRVFARVFLGSVERSYQRYTDLTS